MSPEKVKPLKIGDTLPYLEKNVVCVCTLIEIIVLPEDPAERERVKNQTLDRLNTEGVRIVAGDNLADDPKLAPRVDNNALYIFEA